MSWKRPMLRRRLDLPLHVERRNPRARVNCSPRSSGRSTAWSSMRVRVVVAGCRSGPILPCSGTAGTRRRDPLPDPGTNYAMIAHLQNIRQILPLTIENPGTAERGKSGAARHPAHEGPRPQFTIKPGRVGNRRGSWLKPSRSRPHMTSG
jgi:hypothetical protein